MDQRSFVLYVARKGFMAIVMAMAIHKELVATLGAEAGDCPSVTGYLREAKFALSTHPAAFSEPAPGAR
jgi:hypothetical protein